MFRTETQHALRALASLARRRGILVAGDLAEECQVPSAMMGKILHRLALAGLILGRPGPGGGYRLARLPGEISLREVVDLVEGPTFQKSCLFGLPSCSDKKPCPLHSHWGEVRRRIESLLNEHTVADLARGVIPLPAQADRTFTRTAKSGSRSGRRSSR